MAVEYSEEVATAICNRIADGESLRSICSDDDMPSREAVRLWLSDAEKNEDSKYALFLGQYACARVEQAHHYAEEIIEIADDGSNDTYEDKNGNELVNHDHIARSRLRVDSRKWLASKLAPKKYGDKLAHVGGDEGDAPIKVDRIERVIVNAPAAARDTAKDASDTDGEGI